MKKLSQSILDKMKSWTEEMGLYPVDVAQHISINDLVHTEFVKLSINDLYNILEKVSAYNLFLKTLKCSLSSQKIIQEHEYKIALTNTIMTCLRQDSDLKFKNKDEKEAIALQTNNELKEIHQKLIETETKLARIRDLPYAVDTIIDNVKVLILKEAKNGNN